MKVFLSLKTYVTGKSKKLGLVMKNQKYLLGD
jgi:hypothetical protein